MRIPVKPASFFNSMAPRKLLYSPSQHDENHLLPSRTRMSAKHAVRTLVAKNKELEIVDEFRAKLKTVEDLISKLAFNLREIQDVRQQQEIGIIDAEAKMPAPLIQVPRRKESEHH